VQKEYDWYTFNHTLKVIPGAAKTCTLEDDFSFDDNTKKEWEEAWKYTPPICLGKKQELVFKGIQTSVFGKSIIFRIKKCEDKDLEGTGLKCKSEIE
jgi:hypothetical protein